MNRALVAGTVYFLMLFSLGFVLGTIRVLLVAPRIGEFTATLVEVPIMIVAAVCICRWALLHWRVTNASTIRWAMVLWFLALLVVFETLIGQMLFGRTGDQQWATLATQAGLLGLSAQIVAALLPVFLNRQHRACGT